MRNLPRNPTGDDLITAPVVIQKFGISRPTLWRWQKRNDLNFPAPIVIAGRNYWRARDISEFIDRRAS